MAVVLGGYGVASRSCSAGAMCQLNRLNRFSKRVKGSMSVRKLLLSLLLLLLPSPLLAQQATSGGTTAVPAVRLQASGTARGTASGAASSTLQRSSAGGAVEDKIKAAAAGDVPMPAEAGATSEAAAQTEAQQQAAARLQKIQQLQFDRRPSTILRLWGKPADDAAAKPEESPTDPQAEPPAEPDPFDEQLKQLQKDVTLGNWPAVKQQLAALDPKEAKAAYGKLLQSLRQAPELRNMDPVQMAQMQLVRGQMQQYFESHNITFPDLLGLAAASPEPLDRPALRSLAQLLSVSLRAGNVLEEFVQLALLESAKTEGGSLTRRQVAILLTEANETAEAGRFLPTLDEAQTAQDYEALNLLARHALALHAKEKKAEHLELAWQVLHAVLESQEVKAEEKDEALKRAVEIAPKISSELGKVWLEESFTQRPARGMEILATIGAGASQSLQTHPMDQDYRLNGLRLQTTAAEALIRSAPERAAEWSQALTLLAGNWLIEAQFSYRHDRSTSLGPTMRRDAFGNLFYVDEDDPYAGRPYQQQVQGQAIKVADLLEIKPGAAWLEHVESGLRPKFDMMLAQLYLKVGEEDLAFPRIEGLAQAYPEQAEQLVDEFLSVWTRNHDPNAVRNRTNYYMYMYGFERKAESIPLTRSKQERNLDELAELVQRLGKLPIGELNNELLVRAFTTCHSSAEVYQLEAIEAVFGPIDTLKPETIAELSQQMRANLAGLWRQPDVQQQNQTKRKQKDIEAEVLRGYEVADAVVTDALAKHPDNWQLVLARAALSHDQNNYQKELAPNSTFTEQQQAALAGFARAAEMYAEQAGSLKQDEQTTRVYELWLYASLGACDPQFIDETRVPDVRQPELIRAAIQGLGGELAEHHMTMFANTMFTRLSAFKPNAKYRYLKAGFEIVGEHKQAQEARKVFDYYHDLVTEIKLETLIDGADRVGRDQPFGVFVNLKHTREIERESGGFGRYLQNQNNQRYAYNYGRPTENYRDKFEEIARQALQEHFEVLSVTFQSEDVNSRAVPNEYGWRITPYAYLLLKARSAAADKLPPLRLDLDFLDTSGYAVLPIESPTVPLDASSEAGEPRPFTHLDVTQILDERQAGDGKLVLEVKATARGLVPALDQLLDPKNEQFEIASIDDQGVIVSQFDAESTDNVIVSERNWLVIYQARADLAERPTSFAFARSLLLLPESKLTYQRYEDADLAEAEAVVSLDARYGRTSPRWIWLTSLGLVLGLAVVCGFVILRRAKPEARAATRFALPERIDPFTVLGLLQQIRDADGMPEQQRSSLSDDMRAIEHYFFVEHNGEPAPDLQAIARRWAGAGR